METNAEALTLSVDDLERLEYLLDIIVDQFSVGTLQAILVQNLEVMPPFIIVGVRSGSHIKIRIRQ